MRNTLSLHVDERPEIVEEHKTGKLSPKDIQKKLYKRRINAVSANRMLWMTDKFIFNIF